MRIGNGYDVHKLTPGRKLILGGVDIPYEMGLLGHSDADVLVHAVMDALLGAAALGDIGRHFPDTDPAYKGADSMMLLDHVRNLIEGRGYFIENIDATIIAQKPKLAPYIMQMKTNIATVLGITPDQVNVKATTEEGLGFTGQGLGIAANAVCLLSDIANDIGTDIIAGDIGTDVIGNDIGTDVIANDIRADRMSPGCPQAGSRGCMGCPLADNLQKQEEKMDDPTR